MATIKQFDFEVPGFGEFASPPMAVPAYAQAVSEMSPIAYWRLGESAGSTLADQAGSHPLTVTGGHTLGQAGALQTDGDPAIRLTTGRATSAAPVIPTNAGDAFSIVFWLRTPGAVANDMPFMGQYASGQAGRMLITLLTGGRLRYTAVGDASLLTNAAAGAGWRMFVYTRAADGTARWLVDAQPDAETTTHDTAVHSTGFAIGKLTSSVPDVMLDEVAVFDSDLSLDQARWLFGLAAGELARPPGYGG